MTSGRSGSPPSPSASFYDLSDDEEGEYNTITHSSSGRGVKLLYSKSKVSVLLPDFLSLPDQLPKPARLHMRSADQTATRRSTSTRPHPRKIIFPDILRSFNKSYHLSNVPPLPQATRTRRKPLSRQLSSSHGYPSTPWATHTTYTSRSIFQKETHHQSIHILSRHHRQQPPMSAPSVTTHSLYQSATSTRSPYGHQAWAGGSAV
jgi:hypothetical protein